MVALEREGDHARCKKGLAKTRVGIINSGSVKISQTTFAAIV